ncbi:ComEC/Rec2 family competence protein [Pseudomonas gingeri]|uniref:ComEC/Rec2 family competence protein n=1 Tax=Pseudomonas gingeri TaxID=117681 RepID=UPI001C4A994A|nr:hypothetical protein [Pseudomonas gingeri]
MKLSSVTRIHNLHITSWDKDHCHSDELKEILQRFSPNKIEYPGYEPHTNSGEESLKLILDYKRQSSTPNKIVKVCPKYISSLDPAENYGYRDTLHHPKVLDENSSNNNSTIKHFRSGSFNTLSLGDVECNNIASGLRRQRTIKNEVDVMILAHHGASNGFTTSSFIKHVRPTIAIASSNYANQYEHPKQDIRELLHKNEVKLFTTKTGDVVIFSTGSHTGHYKVVNLKAGSTEVSSEYEFYAKKSAVLKNNRDTIRSIIQRPNKGPR